MKLGPRIRCDEQHVLDLVTAGLTNAQIVDQLGICDRTFTRWRVARPALSQQIITVRARLAAENGPVCGTLRAYRRGCHCDRCREANRIYHYENRMRRREREGLPPPNPRRGRHRAELRFHTGTVGYHVVTADERIEQALASGQTTSHIMATLGVDYERVKAIRDALMAGAA